MTPFEVEATGTTAAWRRARQEAPGLSDALRVREDLLDLLELELARGDEELLDREVELRGDHEPGLIDERVERRADRASVEFSIGTTTASSGTPPAIGAAEPRSWMRLMIDSTG